MLYSLKSRPATTLASTPSGTRTVVKLDADRAVRRSKHWRGIVSHACEQCGRNRLPALDAPVPLAEWLAAGQAEGGGLVLALAASTPLGAVPAPGPGGVHLLVGPEGGLARAEIERAVDAGFRPVRLGPRTLRTETAAVAAVTAVQLLWGDLGN